MTLADTIYKSISKESKSRFDELGLPDHFVAPNYDGRSIVNVPSSIVKTFGGKMRTAPLDPLILGALARGVKRIVFVVVDALGYDKLNEALDANPHNGFHALLKDGGQLVPLTSVFPSTTTAALTALWSGYTPAEHGFMGYQLFLREFGIRSQMISFDPAAMDRLGSGQLVAAGLKPEEFLAVPSLPQTLTEYDVPVYNVIEQPFVKSALSRAQIRGQRETRGFVSSSDMWVTLRAWLEQRKAERALFVAYWSAVDTIAHHYGPASETIVSEVNNFAYSFEREFLTRLSPAAREGTLFLLTADHGQIATPPADAVYMRDHPKLRDYLLMAYTGDPRAAYLYVRNGELNAARDYIETHLANQFFVLDSQVALRAGLFGGGKHSPETRYRIGDLTVLPRAHEILWERDEPPKMLGRHGGLDAQEMLVPLIAARLDA
ncbi:MAG: alkaline phosphatase family protein [Chloroflexota bacterium]